MRFFFLAKIKIDSNINASHAIDGKLIDDFDAAAAV